MNYALITGASSEIRLDMARYLETKKYELILVARDKEKLEKLQEQLPTKVEQNDIIERSDLREKTIQLRI